MAYTMTHDADDMVLNTWAERNRLHVALYFRRDDDQGDLCVEWWDGEAEQAFEDGFLKRERRPGSIRDGDPVLLQSALDYARTHKLPTLAAHAKAVDDAVAAADATLDAAYAAAIAADPAEEDDSDHAQFIAEKVAGKAVAGNATLSGLSEPRRDVIEAYLAGELMERVQAAASAPRP